MHVVDLNTAEGIAEHVRTFTDTQLETLAASESPSHVVFACAAELELIRREGGR